MATATDRIARGTRRVLRILADATPDVLGYVVDVMDDALREHRDFERGHLLEPTSTRATRKKRTGMEEDRSVYRRAGSLDQAEGLSLNRGKDDWTVVPLAGSPLQWRDEDTVRRQR